MTSEDVIFNHRALHSLPFKTSILILEALSKADLKITPATASDAMIDKARTEHPDLSKDDLSAIYQTMLAAA